MASRQLEESSLRLYRTLEAVGLSEEMRRFHRQNVTREIIHTVALSPRESETEVYQFGSSSEGTTTADMGSDIDILDCDTLLPVVTDARDAVGPVCLLMIWDGPTFNGYVKLQVVVNGVPITRHQMEANEHCEPDSLGRMCKKHLTEAGRTRHGAADEVLLPGHDIPHDIVYALKCVNVPDVATLWLKRPRNYDWPSRRCVDRVSALPHFVVGVGHPFSRERDIEWRVSYSLHERELMFSLNTVQHQCYGFMKMVKKNIIEPAVGEECITSYHCKTVLFWVIENTPAYIWRPNTLFTCIFTCFMYFKYFLITKTCPNFFNQDSNLFEREIFERQHDRLTLVINLILRSIPDITSLIMCSNVRDIYRSGRVPRQINEAILKQKFVSNMNIINIKHLLDKQLSHIVHGCGSQRARTTKLFDLLNTYSQVRCITEHTEEQTEDARQFMLPCIHFRLATCLASEGLRVNPGPLRAQLLGRAADHLHASRGRDLMTSRLINVTISYELLQYQQCYIILQQIENDLRPFVLTSCKCYEKPFWYDMSTLRWLESENVTGRSMVTSGIATCLTFLPSEREIVPEPLQYELDRSKEYPNIPATDDEGHSVFDWACVDGKVYFYLMQYLVNTQLNKRLHAEAARDNIRWVINDDLNLAHKDTAYNVLGWIYVQERNYTEAIRCWKLSYEERPYHNAVICHCRSLLHNEHFRAATA